MLGLAIAPASLTSRAKPMAAQLDPALAILAGYGADAHLWLPGVGQISGLTVSNFIESSGTSPAAVDGPVGYVGDRYGTLNATQATTASKPILRQSGGLYSWQFDGVDDRFALSSPAFQPSDNYAVVAFARLGASGASRCVFGQGNGTANGSTPFVGFNGGGIPALYYHNGSTAIYNLTAGGSSRAGQALVLASRKASGQLILRENGVLKIGPVSAPSGSDAVSARIGSHGRTADGEFFLGNIGPVIAIKGTVSDADLLTLERWVGSLSGVTIP